MPLEGSQFGDRFFASNKYACQSAAHRSVDLLSEKNGLSASIASNCGAPAVSKLEHYLLGTWT